MMRPIADWNLIFGMLALHMDFVSRDALITARNASPLDEPEDLGRVLLSQGALVEDDRRLLDSLVRKYVEKHEHDARRSLAALNRVLPPCAELDPDATTPPLPGASDSPELRFRLIRLHASGGLGEVWIAMDIELKRQVAVKQLRGRRADDPESRARFLREAEITGRLEHRGIVPVYGLGRFEDGRLFYAMRFLGGTSLKDAIEAFHRGGVSRHARDDGSLELRRLLGRFVDVCDTMAYAHSRGVLHRDLKPGNIIVDEFGETLVVDWGLAKVVGQTAGPAADDTSSREETTEENLSTQTGAAMGTPAYMSPEQAFGRPEELGPATDVYSLGATLYCLLTGRPAFAEREPHLVLADVRQGAFPPPRQVDPRVPLALEAICLKAMALQPEDRYASARALGEDVERWLADRPVDAYPEPRRARAARWVRHHKRGVTIAVALAFASMIALGIHDLRLGRERRRTGEQLAMTRAILRELLRVSGEALAQVSNREKLRESLAQVVLDRYQELGARFPNDPGVLLETAQVYRVLAGIGRVTAEFDKSRDAYNKAITILKRLCDQDQGRSEYRQWLIEALIERGELNHMNGRTIDAEEDFRAALDHIVKLPESLRVASRRQRAETMINLSEILLVKDRHADAHEAADSAVGLLRPLESTTPKSGTESRDLWLLSLALCDRAVAAMGGGDLGGALQDLGEAENVALRVPAAADVYDDAQSQIASIANRRGELLARNPARLREAEESYGRAILLLEKLRREHALIPHHREEMAVGLSGRAAVRLASRLLPAAESDCAVAREHIGWLMEQRALKAAPESPDYLGLLGRTLARESRVFFAQGRPAEGRRARAEAMEKLIRAIRIDPARVIDETILDQLRAERDGGE